MSLRRKLTNTLLVGLLMIIISGCSGFFGKRSPQEVSEKRQNLAHAVSMIHAGLDIEARHYLELVINDSLEEGVTDEALFRLALLQLNDGELGSGKSSNALLGKLMSGFPTSVWAKQAAPLQSYLLGVQTIRKREREVNALRDKNLSLSRDVRELRQTIERLKALDLELEQKIRR
jgi:hypothetical protein